MSTNNNAWSDVDKSDVVSKLALMYELESECREQLEKIQGTIRGLNKIADITSKDIDGSDLLDVRRKQLKTALITKSDALLTTGVNT